MHFVKLSIFMNSIKLYNWQMESELSYPTLDGFRTYLTH